MPVVLHPPGPEDREPFLAAVRRSRALHDPWTVPPDSPAAFDRWARRRVDPGEAPRIARLVPPGAEDAPRRGRIVGVANLSRIDRGPLMGASAGWYGLAGGTGRGWMAEAVSRLLDLAFGELGLHRVEANVQPGNAPSRRLAARVGFRLEGFSPRYLRIGGAWRDHERWAMLTEEWTVGGGPRGAAAETEARTGTDAGTAHDGAAHDGAATAAEDH